MRDDCARFRQLISLTLQQEPRLHSQPSGPDRHFLVIWPLRLTINRSEAHSLAIAIMINAPALQRFHASDVQTRVEADIRCVRWLMMKHRDLESIQDTTSASIWSSLTWTVDSTVLFA